MNKYKIGFAPSDIANNINPRYRLPEQIHLLSEFAIKEQCGFELEMEESFAMPGFKKPEGMSFLGVHQPSGGVDINDVDKKQESISKIKDSMLMAQEIDAEYFTVHLQTKDRWHGERERKEHISVGLEVFDELANYYRKNNFNFTVNVENIEYPKYPATVEEIEELSTFLDGYSDINTGIVLDIGHLWRTRNLMNENWIFHEGQDLPFSQYLNRALYESDFANKINVFHITGCGGYQTHLLPQIDMVEPTDGSIRTDEYYFRTLGKMVLSFVRNNNYRQYIVNEAFGHNYEIVVSSNKDIVRIEDD
jgi:hypothetical protein